MPPHGDEIRARLLDLARREPGLSLAGAGAALGLDSSTIAYHARILARRGKPA